MAHVSATAIRHLSFPYQIAFMETVAQILANVTASVLGFNRCCEWILDTISVKKRCILDVITAFQCPA